MWLDRPLRKFVIVAFAVVAGTVAATGFLIVTFGLWRWLITPFLPTGSQILRLSIFIVEMSFYCVAGLVFGGVAALVAPRGGYLLFLGGGLVGLVGLVPFMLLEGQFNPSMLVFTVPVAVVCAALVKTGQAIVGWLRFREQ